jgi:hypothetical protein
MRISELLAARVVDERGREVGWVHDVRFARVSTASGEALEVTGLAVGPGGLRARAAHSWGFAEGRAQAPLLLEAPTRNAVRASRFIPAERVLDWNPPTLRIEGSARELEALTEWLRHE